MSNDISSARLAQVPAGQEPAAAQPLKAAVADKVASAFASSAVSVDPQAKRRELQQAIERLHDEAKKSNYNLSFSIDEASDYVVVKIRDADNGEVVRQIPNDTVLRVSHYFKGLLKDEKI